MGGSCERLFLWSAPGGVLCVCVFEDWGGLVPCVEVDMFGWEGRLCQLGGCM